MADVVWLPHAIETLRRLWDEGHSASEIGRRMGCGKNAVIGKAHRLKLPSRAHCITKQVKPRAPRPSRAGRAERSRAYSTRAVIEAKPAPKVLPPLPVEVASVVVERPPVPVAPPPVVARPVVPVPVHRTCQWPTGDKATGRITFVCTDETMPGRPYCSAHCARAYEPRRGPARAA